MASYVPSNVNPAYFEVPTFEQPLDFLYNIARQKQMQFDQGLNAVHTQYQSMQSLPTTSKIATSKRDAYMQEASDKLRKIAGADFSLPENVGVANSIYKPLTSDQDILKDLSDGKALSKNYTLMDSLQNSTDEKQRGMYWSIGREQIDRAARKLQNANTSQELQSINIPTYTPYSDIVSKLNKAAQEQKLAIEWDRITPDGFKITSLNGNQTVEPFNLWAQSQLGPEERSVLQVMGDVQAQRDVDNLMSTKGLSEKEAKISLAGNVIDDRFRDLVKMKYDAEDSITGLQDQLKTVVGSQITDQNIGQRNDILNKIDSLKAKKDAVEEQIRNLGYDNNNARNRYIKTSRYNDTLNSYAYDLSVPYSEIATSNVTRNWALGFANSNTKLSISEAPNYQKGIDLQIEQAKLTATRDALLGKSATTSSSSKGSTKEEQDAAATEEYNTPVEAGTNPYSQTEMKSYDYFKTTENALQENFYEFGRELIDAAGLPVSTKLLDKLVDNLKQGAANESLIGNSAFSLKNDPDLKADINNLMSAVDAGGIKGKGGEDFLKYADLFGALTTSASQKLKDLLNSNPTSDTDKQKALYMANVLRNFEKNNEAFRVFKADEANINKQILSSDKYKPYVKNGQFMSKEEFMMNKYGFKSAEDYDNLMLGIAEGTANAIASQTSPVLINPAVTGWGQQMLMPDDKYISMIKDESINYDKAKAGFDQDFANYVNQKNPQYLQGIKTPNGNIAFDYPVYQLRLRKNPSSGERELGEVALSRAFQDENIARATTKVTNLSDLGHPDDIQDIMNAMKANVNGDIDDNDGSVYSVQATRGGNGPGILFRPSRNFMVKVFGEKAVGSNSDITNILTHGIEIATDVPEVEKAKPSLVGRLVSMDSTYNILPELKDKGFSGHFEKAAGGRGYKLFLSYKKVNPDGTEKTVNDEWQNPGEPIQESRLDNLSDSLLNQILNAYFLYNSQKSAFQPKPQQIYTEEEAEKIRKQMNSNNQ